MLYERTYGQTYDKDLTTKEIAARVRAQLRRDTGDKASPLHGWAVKVRYKGFTGGTSIDVYLVAPAGVEACHRWDSWNDNDDATRCEKCGRQAVAERSAARRWYWLTAPARAARGHAESILNGYNHDGSDAMTDYFDVNFYGAVNVSDHGDKAPTYDDL
jgi:hypothetical protein